MKRQKNRSERGLHLARGKAKARMVKKKAVAKGKAPATKAGAQIKKIKGTDRSVKKVAKVDADDLAEKARVAASMNRVRTSISEPYFLEFISRNVGTKANDIISTLTEGPLVDDKIAEQLSLKLNETRRMLNVLNTYGLVRYNINKNSEGWLSFIWYLDADSVKGLDVRIKANASRDMLPEGCNDFFVCGDCSKTHKIVLPFEVAFDSKFRCNCGKKLQQITRTDAEQLYRKAVA